jgi:hypothetical protein
MIHVLQAGEAEQAAAADPVAVKKRIDVAERKMDDVQVGRAAAMADCSSLLEAIALTRTTPRIPLQEQFQYPSLPPLLAAVQV